MFGHELILELFGLFHLLLSSKSLNIGLQFLKLSHECADFILHACDFLLGSNESLCLLHDFISPHRELLGCQVMLSDLCFDLVPSLNESGTLIRHHFLDPLL